MAITLSAAGRTDIGLVRKRNEDSLYTGESLFAVADGMGGYVAGDIASTTVIDALRPFDQRFEPDELMEQLGHAFEAANSALAQRIKSEPEADGMGTTLVAMLCSGTTAVLGNVGDSRAYLLRGPASQHSDLRQITEDHQYGRLLADAADVPNLPGRLTRFLDGRIDGRSPDLSVRELQEGDRFLLCSDGLSGVVEYQEIHSILASGLNASEAADALVAKAIDGGGPDNVTAVIIDVLSP